MSAGTPRHPWRFLAVALALGPLFSVALLLWTEVLRHVHLPFSSAQGPLFFERLGLQLFASNAVIAGATTAAVAWRMRHHILQAEGRERFVVALGSALLGGPLFCFLYGLFGRWGSAIPGASGSTAGFGEWLVSALLGGTLIGVILGPIYLPITLPVSWFGVGLLRKAGGRLGGTPSA